MGLVCVVIGAVDNAIKAQVSTAPCCLILHTMITLMLRLTLVAVTGSMLSTRADFSTLEPVSFELNGLSFDVQAGLHGRKFGDNRVHASFYQPALFEQRDLA